MQIVIDLDTRKPQRSLTDSRTATQFDFKRGDDAVLEILFVRAGVQTQLTVGIALTFGVKLRGRYDSTPLVQTNDFTLSGSGATAKYIGYPSFNTAELNEAFGIDDSETNDVAVLDLMGEISWTEPTTEILTSSETFSVRVNNDVNREDDAPPNALPSPSDWLDARAVRFDKSQTLTDAQKQIARGNIDAMPEPIIRDTAPVEAVAAVAARAVMVLAGPSLGDTFTIDGVVFEFVASAGSDPSIVYIGLDELAPEESWPTIIMAINANVASVSATFRSDDSELDIVADTAGTSGNSIAVSTIGGVSFIDSSYEVVETLVGGAAAIPATAAQAVGQLVRVGAAAPYTWHRVQTLSPNTFAPTTPTIAEITGLPAALDAKQPLDSDLTAYANAADAAARRALLALAPDTTGNTNLNAILAAGPAASRDALGAVNISPSEQLIEAMKRAGIWTACVALKVFGKDSTERGYALNFETGGFTRVRCGDFRPTSSSSFSAPIAASLSSCAIYTATVGGEVTEVGTERTILALHSGVSLPGTNGVRIYKATSSVLTIQVYGGGSQSFHNPATTVGITNGTAPRTCFVNLDVSTNSVTIGIDGVLQTPLTYSHGDPAAMARITGGNMQATYNTIAVFNRPLTETEYVAFDSAVKNTVFGNRANIVLEGDSIIGYYVSSVQMPRRYLLGAASSWAGETWYDISTGGNATNDVLTQWPAQLDTYIAQGAIDRSIVVLWLGANDFGNYTAAVRPVAQIHANLRTLWAIAKARGFKVVAVVPYYLAVRLADYPTLRNLILADEGIYYDVCIDMHAAFDSAVGGSYWLDTAYFGDGVHPTTVEAQRIIATAFDEVSDRVFLR